MAGLEAAEVAAIRTDALEWLQDTARILVRSSAPTAGGGQKEIWTPTPNTVPCRIAPYSQNRTGGESGSAGDRIDDRLKCFITLPFDAEISTKDRIEIEGAATYEVLSIHPRESDRFVRRVEAKEVF